MERDTGAEVDAKARGDDGYTIMDIVDRRRHELRGLLTEIPEAFEDRELLRDEWTTVFDRLPPELCRDEADMQEMIIRVSKGQSRTHRLGKFI